jgi:DNA-binding XRE family transcriptional regulator
MILSQLAEGRLDWIDALRQDGHDDAIHSRGLEGGVMPQEKGYFADRLRELRRAAGLSQPGLAEASGVAVSTIREFEQGRREPTLGTLLKLAAGLSASLSAFDPPPGQPKPARKSRGK